MAKGIRVQRPGGGESPTQQHFKDKADINVIMAKAKTAGATNVAQALAAGMITGPGVATRRQPIFTTLTGMTWHDMLLRVQEVQAEFNRLPAPVRRKFNNNPELLIKYSEDPKNLPKLVQMGVLRDEDLPYQVRQQMDLVRESELKDWKEFKSWQAARAKGLPQGKRRANAANPPAEGGEGGSTT